jgi:phage protein D
MSENPIHIYTDYDFYVPAFEVRIKGRSLDRDVLRDVVSVSYTDSLGRMDSCELTLNNWDADKRDFKYIDSDLFDPGGQIELYMGYYDKGGLTLMLRGTIVSLSPNFPAGGQPTLQVRALNQLYRLHFKQDTQVYENKTDTEIAQAILGKISQEQPNLNLELETRPANQQIETLQEYVLINNQYPIVYLMERARHNGYDIYIEDDEENGRTVSKLHFHPSERGVPAVYKLVWGQSLITFKPTLRTSKQVSKVTVRGWDARKREEIVGEATRDDLPFNGLPNQEALSAVDSALAGSEIVISDEPVISKADADQKALDHLTNRAKDMVTGSGSVVGLPEIRAGRPVYICKLGARFSGRYIITSSTHSIADSGYTTTFEARMEELKQGGSRNPCDS